MKVLLSHYLFARAGGGERIMSTVVDELVRNGVTVSMATLCRSDYSTLFAKYFDRASSGNVHDYWLFPFYLPVFGVYQRLLTPIPTWIAMKSSKPDVLFVDHEMFKPVRGLREGCRIVWFCHFPYVAWALERFGEETVPDKYRVFPWNVYWRGFLALQRLVVIEENFADLTLVNSSYTGRHVKRIWGTDPLVVYPPVDLSSFDPSRDKKDLIVSLGRFSPEKRFEEVLRAIALSETSSPLVIIGTLTVSGLSYLRYLRELTKRLGLDGRVHFLANAGSDQLRRILAEAKLYVHCMKNEHFGISVAEAMASGCVPIVPRSGGCWEDIVSEGKFGLGWDSLTELAETIDDLITNDPKRMRWKRIAVERSRIFDEKSFREKMRHLLLEE